MLVAVRGLAVETGVQTGDGRYFVPGSIDWAEGVLPLCIQMDGSMHVDLNTSTPQVGTINALAAADSGVTWSGFIDDQIAEGAEALRRMREGSAPFGNRFGISIDPDNWAFQIVDTTGDVEMMLLAASGTVAAGQRFDWHSPLRALVRAGMAPSLIAAAGDGDPLADPNATILFEDGVDGIVMRFTRLRIRGATMCNIPAFAPTYCEIDDGTSPAAAVAEGGGVQVHVHVASSRPAISLVTPPLQWFGPQGLPCATPNTITREGHVFGHLAAWGTCHTGYEDRCVTPPRGGDNGYSHFHVGEVETAEGERVATGAFAWGIPHADLSLRLIEAFAHYANSRHGWADVVVGEDEHGIWYSGALRPGLTAEDVRILRALSLSGDWRRDPSTRRLGFVAGLAVNFPGYPIPRVSGLTASASIGGETFDFDSAEAPTPTMQLDGDEVVALIACGRVAPAAADDCGCGPTGSLPARMSRLEAQMAVLHPTIAAELDKRVV